MYLQSIQMSTLMNMIGSFTHKGHGAIRFMNHGFAVLAVDSYLKSLCPVNMMIL